MGMLGLFAGIPRKKRHGLCCPEVGPQCLFFVIAHSGGMQKKLNPVATALKAAVLQKLRESRSNVSFFKDELTTATALGSENYRTAILAAFDEWRTLKKKAL